MKAFPQEPKSLLVAGDTHRDPQHLHYLYDEAAKWDVDGIVQVGDYGFYMGDGGTFCDHNSELAGRYDIPLVFLDGNHEDHRRLRYWYTNNVSKFPEWNKSREFQQMNRRMKKKWHQPNVVESEEGFFRIREGVWYAPRGARWEWSGVPMMAFGGAISVDKHRRTEGISWWPEEAIDPEEVIATADADPVKILFTHDVPNEVPITHLFWLLNRQYTVHEASDRNRQLLSQVIANVQPEVVIHGHMHVAYTMSVPVCGKQTSVIGLSCNGSGMDSYTVIFLEDYLD